LQAGSHANQGQIRQSAIWESGARMCTRSGHAEFPPAGKGRHHCQRVARLVRRQRAESGMPRRRRNAISAPDFTCQSQVEEGQNSRLSVRITPSRHSGLTARAVSTRMGQPGQARLRGHAEFPPAGKGRHHCQAPDFTCQSQVEEGQNSRLSVRITPSRHSGLSSLH
jgi:hypothetical protein